MSQNVELIRSEIDVSDFVIGKFNDLRLQKTGALLFKKICTMFSTCIKKLAGERKLEVSFGRFLQHSNVTIDEISSVLVKKTNSNCKDRKHVLSIQDTVESGYPTQSNKKDLFGTGSDSSTKSFFAHPSILVDAFNKDILGIGSIMTWTRTNEEVPHRSQRPIEEKESIRWIETAASTKKNITEDVIITHIADREADIYEFFSRIPDERNHLIIRSNHDRKLHNDKLLSEYMEDIQTVGKYKIELPTITGVRKKRTATIEIKFSNVKILRTATASSCEKEKVKLVCIEAKEISIPPLKEEPIFWRLLTTHIVITLEEAKQIVIWYTWRWIIEQIFRTMKKKGFKIEESQIENPQSLLKMFVLGLAAAVQILSLVYARDGKSKRSASDLFSKKELIVLLLLLKKVEGNTLKQKNPYDKNTLSWAAWIIARLGTWYPGASHPPGPITMYEGLKKFNSIFETWEMLQKDTCIG